MESPFAVDDIKILTDKESVYVQAKMSLSVIDQFVSGIAIGAIFGGLS